VESFDAVVLGSGFGGSVAAWRMQNDAPECRVLLLERGMPYPPGSFARTPAEIAGNFWDPDSQLFGMYETWAFEHSEVLVSSGLGGGSLIYANVMLEKPEGTFTIPGGPGEARDWPVGHAELTASYKVIREMLDPKPLPGQYHSPARGRAAVPKTGEFIAAARAAGLDDAQLADIAVSFEGEHGVEPGARIDGENLHGRVRHTCTLSGECDAGCNEGAKNTLDFNFLTEFARAPGSAIWTCCEAVNVRTCDDGFYEVRYLQHLEARRRVLERANDEQEAEHDRALLHPEEVASGRVRAGVVVIACGTLGSTRLLLRSRPELKRLSPRLGSGFSSNGDALLFARGCKLPDDTERRLAPSRGPTITAYATSGKGQNRLWLQDAGGPVVAEWGWQLPAAGARLARTACRTGLRAVGRRLRGEGGPGRVSRDLSDALGDPVASASMLPMLGMGFDHPGGNIGLDRTGLSLDWNPSDSREHFERTEVAATRVAKALGGRIWPPGLVRERMRGTTVHPLGGCPMGRCPEEGVVDASCEVFGYKGLFVADGSVMPGPVGPNPSMTIAALAHRTAEAATAAMRGRRAGPGGGAAHPGGEPEPGPAVES